MTSTSAAPTEGASQRQPSAHERRRHRRVALPLKARYMLEDGSEHECELENISVGGALLKADGHGHDREKIILYIEQIGRFEAEIVRVTPVGFAVRFSQRGAKMHRTADALTWLLNGGDNKRTAPRLRQNKESIVVYEDGTEAQCVILDISLTGASLDIRPKPPIGTNLMMGRTAARVVRHHEAGVGVMFTGGAQGGGSMKDVMQSLKK